MMIASEINLVATNVTPHLAFNTTKFDASSGYYNNSNQGRGKFYRRFGSERGKCSFSIGWRGFHQQISSRSSVASSFGGENRPVYQICGEVGHSALQCWHRFNHIYQYEELPSALVALRITDVTEHTGQKCYPDTSE